jgi:hypothetical protein
MLECGLFGPLFPTGRQGAIGIPSEWHSIPEEGRKEGYQGRIPRKGIKEGYQRKDIKEGYQGRIPRKAIKRGLALRPGGSKEADGQTAPRRNGADKRGRRKEKRIWGRKAWVPWNGDTAPSQYPLLHPYCLSPSFLLFFSLFPFLFSLFPFPTFPFPCLPLIRRHQDTPPIHPIRSAEHVRREGRKEGRQESRKIRPRKEGRNEEREMGGGEQGRL